MTQAAATKSTKAATPATPVEARKRFSFGPVWTAAVKAGTVKDQDKLIAHGVKLKVGTKSDLSRLKMDTLLGKVTAALNAAPAADETPAS